MYYLEKKPNKSDKVVIISFGLALLIGALAFAEGYLALVLLAILLFAVIGVFYIKPEVGIYLMALCLPITDWMFNYKDFSVSFIETIALLLIVAYALHLLDPGKLKKLRFPLFFTFFLFFLATIISSLSAKYISPSLWFSVRWFLLFYLAYILLPYNIINSAKIFKKTTIFLSVSGVLVAFMGAASLFFQDFSDNFFRVQPLSIFGIYPIGFNHNSLAEFLVVTSFIILSLKYWFKDARSKKIINLVFLFMVLVAIGTFSRTAWLAVALQFMLYFGYDFFFVKNKRMQSREVIMALALLLIVSFPLVQRMTTLQEANTSSTANRLLLTQIAWRAYVAHPFTGYGPGTFVGLVDDNTRFRAQYGDPLDSHGLGQKVIAELGTLGLLTFALFCGSMFYKFYKALKRYP